MVDPRNGIVLAKAIADRLAKLEPSKAAKFRQNAEQYSDDLKRHISRWEQEVKPLAGKSVVTYHKSWIYFSSWVGLDEVGYVEPKPGIPPSPDHVAKLIPLIKHKGVRFILMEPFYPKGVATDVARETGAKLLVLPVEVNGSPEAKTYIDVFEQIVRTLKNNS
jgi:zinc/manganese transport system substrate-binding protein